MTATSIGSGIQVDPGYVAPETEPTSEQLSHFLRPDGFDLEAIKQAVRTEMRGELDAAVADIERRYAMAREIEQSTMTGETRTIHTEDLNLTRHLLDGYTLTSNSPTTGSIAWASLRIVYLGVDYKIANGSTANKFVWFVKPASYVAETDVTLQSSNTLPVLGPNDTLVFVNNAGVAIDAASSNVSWAVGTGVVGDAQISGGIAQSKIAGLADTFTSLNGSIQGAINIAEGAITQHFGTTFPWANGSAQPSNTTGDVYTVQGAAAGATPANGTSYRWSGPTGSPANTWILIEDTALAKALADSASALGQVNGKTTVFYANAANTPTATAVNDEWVVLDQNNKRRRATAVGTGSWVDVLIGDAALATGISGTKIGAGISPANLTGTGVVPIGGIPQIGPTKINAAVHLFY